MIVVNYRSFVAKLTAGISFCRAYFGDRMTGFQGLLGDMLAEATRFAIISHMPGHPEQAEDALNQEGSDRGIFRYRGETAASWATRVRNAWECYEQCSTDIQLMRAINEWGAIVFPATWVPSQVNYTENNIDGTFVIWISAGVTPWGTAWSYGDGSSYGDGLLWGITNALPEDVDTLCRIVRKWQRLSSKGRGCIVLSGHVWGEPGLAWGGFDYDDGSRIILGF